MKRGGPVKARRDARASHECGWDCPCPAGRARTWATFPRADLVEAEWDYLTQLLLQRSGRRCEICGVRFEPGRHEENRHHRRGRGKGGTDDPAINGLANLLLICAGRNARLGGVSGCHGEIGLRPDWARERGLVVPWGAYTGEDEPPEVSAPVTLASGRRVLLDPLAPFYADAPLCGSRGERTCSVLPARGVGMPSTGASQMRVVRTYSVSGWPSASARSPRR
jgi:hypothetical protein